MIETENSRGSDHLFWCCSSSLSRLHGWPCTTGECCMSLHVGNCPNLASRVTGTLGFSTGRGAGRFIPMRGTKWVSPILAGKEAIPTRAYGAAFLWSCFKGGLGRISLSCTQISLLPAWQPDSTGGWFTQPHSSTLQARHQALHTLAEQQKFLQDVISILPPC